MADYFPLISRAVAGLDKNTGEIRRALYERARTALVNQLRSVEPALNESDITRERLALEESIRKVEAEAAKRSRPEASEVEDPRRSLRDHGLRDFRETVADAEGLGDAATQANRSARATYDAVPGEHPTYAGNADLTTAERAVEPPATPPFQPPPMREPVHETPQTDEHAEAPAETWPHPPGSPYDEDDAAYARPPRSYGRIVKLVLLLLVIGGLAGAGYWQRHEISSLVANFRSSAPAPKPKEAVQPASRPKIADRIGGADDAASNSANAPAASVAQKVVLYDEDSESDPKGKRYVGSAIGAPKRCHRGRAWHPSLRSAPTWKSPSGACA